MTPARPRLQVACNNPDNGLFAHRAPALKVFDAEFDSRSISGPRFIESWHQSPDRSRLEVRLAGKTWPTTGCTEWIGNWCWNEYQLGDGSRTAGWWMVDFLTWLRSRRLYTCTHGTQTFHAWFNGHGHASPSDIHTMIYEQRFV